MKRRTFNIHRPVNRDVVILVLVEYEWDEGKENEAVQRVLTEDGWVEFQPWEMVNEGALPHITGLDMHVTGRADAHLDAFVAKVRGILSDERATVRMELTGSPDVRAE